MKHWSRSAIAFAIGAFLGTTAVSHQTAQLDFESVGRGAPPEGRVTIVAITPKALEGAS